MKGLRILGRLSVSPLMTSRDAPEVDKEARDGNRREGILRKYAEIEETAGTNGLL
jgi:hypothetical protein